MGSTQSASDSTFDHSLLDTKSVDSWTVECVCHWVIYKGDECPALSKLNVQLLIQHQITGAKLLELDDDALKTVMMIKKKSYRTQILAALAELKSEFESGGPVMKMKI